MPTNNPHGSMAINLRLDIDAITLLRQRFGTRHGHGRYLSRLIFEDFARREERARQQSSIFTVKNDSENK